MSRSELSVKVIVEALEETLAEVHVSDGVDRLGEADGTRQLSVVMAPVMLDTFKMPLINQDNDLVALSTVYLLVEILIPLVNKDLLQSREEDLRALDVPVDEVLVEALFGEGLGACVSDLLAVGKELLNPGRLLILETVPEVEGHLHAGLVIETLSRDLVHLCAEEL